MAVGLASHFPLAFRNYGKSMAAAPVFGNDINAVKSGLGRTTSKE